VTLSSEKVNFFEIEGFEVHILVDNLSYLIIILAKVDMGKG